MAAIKFFFRIKDESSVDGFIEESMNQIEEFANLLESEISSGTYSAAGDVPPALYKVQSLIFLTFFYLLPLFLSIT